MAIPLDSVLNTKGQHRIATSEFLAFSLLVVFLYSPVSGSDGFSVVEIVIKSSYTICLILIFVRGPGLVKFSFIGGNSNSNIFTKILISTGNSCI